MRLSVQFVTTAAIAALIGCAVLAQTPTVAPVASTAPVPAATEEPPPPAATPPKAILAKPKRPGIIAKVAFAAKRDAADLAPRAIGFYSKGCLAGGRAIAIDGEAWQVMRLSRNRNWGHPAMIAWLEQFAKEVQIEGWPGLLIGDIAQPRGGPMLTGHASHQIGLDADIWLTPMPDRRLTAQEREDISATSMLVEGDPGRVDPKVWTGRHVALIRHAALSPRVERVLVHPAIKKALCQNAGGERGWLAKVRPYWGHYYHMHIRLGCPADSPNCRGQAPPPGDDGCGKEVDDWLRLVTRPPPPPAPPPPPGTKPPKPPRQIMVDELPPECRAVLSR